VKKEKTTTLEVTKQELYELSELLGPAFNKERRRTHTLSARSIETYNDMARYEHLRSAERQNLLSKLWDKVMEALRALND
jgi:hypothetical protein